MESWVKLYDPNTGALVTFSLPVSEDEIATVAESLRALAAAGFSATLPGTEPGQRVETITAAVLGETSRDEPCVYLYGDTRLKFRLVTVWQEQIPLLPEDLRAKLRKVNAWPGAAPDRETAERKRVLVPANFRAVLENTGTEDSPKWRFVRVLSQHAGSDAGRKAAAPTESAAANTSGRPYPPEELRKRFPAAAKQHEKSGDAPHHSVIAALLGKVIASDELRHVFTAWLTGNDDGSAKALTAGQRVAFAVMLTGKYRPDFDAPISDFAVAEVRDAVRAAAFDAGRSDLLMSSVAE